MDMVIDNDRGADEQKGASPSEERNGIESRAQWAQIGAMDYPPVHIQSLESLSPIVTATTHMNGQYT